MVFTLIQLMEKKKKIDDNGFYLDPVIGKKIKLYDSNFYDYSDGKGKTSFIIMTVDSDYKPVLDPAINISMVWKTRLRDHPVKVDIGIEDNGDGSFLCTYDAPLSAGTYTISCLIDQQSIKNFPVQFDVRERADREKSFIDGPGITSRCADGHGIFYIHPLSHEGNPVIDVMYDIKMDGPQGLIPLNITIEEDGIIKVDYQAPLPPGVYNITYFLDEEPQAKPIQFTIKKEADASKCYAEGPGLNPAGPDPSIGGDDPTAFTVHIVDDGNTNVKDATCAVKMVGPERKEVKVDVVDNADGTFTCTYKRELMADGGLPPGNYLIITTVNGAPLKNGHIKLIVLKRIDQNNSYADGAGLSTHKIGSGMDTFNLFLKDCNGRPAYLNSDELNVTLTRPDGKLAKFNLEIDKGNDSERTHIIEYFPTLPGDYIINVEVNGKSVKGLPITIKCKKGGKGSQTHGLEFTVTIVSALNNNELKTEGGDDFNLTVMSPENKMVPVILKDAGDGTYSATYTLDEHGLFDIEAQINGHDISIFEVKNEHDMRTEEQRQKEKMNLVFHHD